LTAPGAGPRFEDVLRDDYLMRLVRQLADALRAARR
jgi:hypothetical protein